MIGHWDRPECAEVIRQADYRCLKRHSCFFCPASKKHEIFELKRRHPDLLKNVL